MRCGGREELGMTLFYEGGFDPFHHPASAQLFLGWWGFQREHVISIHLFHAVLGWMRTNRQYRRGVRLRRFGKSIFLLLRWLAPIGCISRAVLCHLGF